MEYSYRQALTVRSGGYKVHQIQSLPDTCKPADWKVHSSIHLAKKRFSLFWLESYKVHFDPDRLDDHPHGASEDQAHSSDFVYCNQSVISSVHRWHSKDSTYHCYQYNSRHWQLMECQNHGRNLTVCKNTLHLQAGRLLLQCRYQHYC